MKRVFIMAITAISLIGCNKDEGVINNDDAVVNLRIHVDKTVTKAIETGHPSGKTYAPKIYSALVIPYNSYGVSLGEIKLTDDQLSKALYGNYILAGTTVDSNAQPEGVTIGMPAGTTHVDVLLNRPSTDDGTTNINYFNYRDNKGKGDNPYKEGTDNFERVTLVTKDYGRGAALEGHLDSTTGKDGKPVYKMTYEVSPGLARLEVYGGIQVAEEEEWKDYFGRKWKTMPKTEMETKFDEAARTKYGIVVGTGTSGNGFPDDKAYIPDHYWYVQAGKTLSQPEKDTEYIMGGSKGTVATESEIDDTNNNIDFGWVLVPDFATLPNTEPVKWFPNYYYAVDVEEIYVNNIKVRDASRDPFMLPWPGSEAAAGWPDWYKAYHEKGWHTAGTSENNTFLCMGNMWDRIVGSNANVIKVQYPSVTSLGMRDEMDIYIGKTTPVTDKGQYWNTTTGGGASANRNIGIVKDKASAFQIYAQSSNRTTKETLANELPHVILKVKAYESKAAYESLKEKEYVSGKEFITMKVFTVNGSVNNDFLTSFQAGYIYRIDLNSLISAFVGKIPVPGGVATEDPKDPIDPDPEMPGVNVVVSVKVNPWKVTDITPSI